MNIQGEFTTLPAGLQVFLESRLKFLNMVLPWNYPETSDLNSFQIGYRVDGRSGESLVSQEEGEWNPSWWVIASNYFDDPFLIEITEPIADSRILFAQHGAGSWNPVVVAESATELISRFEVLRSLEGTPLAAAEYIEEHFPKNYFWEEVAETYREMTE